MGIGRRANTRGRFEGHAAYSSFCSVVLPFRPSARAAAPLGPRRFLCRLRAWEQRWVLRLSRGADRKANTRELVREVGGLLERLQRRVALETRCNRGSSFGAELIVLKTAWVWR